MDDKWFKHRQKIAGVTAEDIGVALGRDRSIVSRIYVGRQKMDMEQAKVFARILDVPLADVMHHAGMVDGEEIQNVPGFSEKEVTPFVGQGSVKKRTEEIASILGGDKPGIDIWQVQTNTLALSGYLPGDKILVDSNQSESCRAGDIVIGQIYDWNTGTAETVIRRYEPPVLIAVGSTPNDIQAHIVDHRNVVIKGKVVACWRHE